MSILADKAIVITGAGAGIGAAYARHAATLGASVVVNDIDEPAARAVASQITARGGDALACPGDVSSWDFGQSLISACVDRFGRIDGLVNNAGILRHGRLSDIRRSDFEAMLRVNTIGAAGCIVAAVPYMVEGGRPASIVNVASGSQAGDIALGGYAASKAGVAALTFSWAMELRGSCVRMNAVSPLAETAMAASNKDFLALQSSQREVAYTELPSPESNAPVVTYLLSDASAGINGQIVRIAGAELSFVTHPMIADPVLRGEWTDEGVARAFGDILSEKQQTLGLAYMKKEQE